ncbi:hypothetical protein [Caballeronia sp. LZ034LL]|uniref:hypothetical protein n=1 Tax=Caballeronia sp. LZ034LL TaxID=3038567 RepID=UPI00285F2E48|nr:hypothetical protein [Caballeronia sp. LZ034LL]MDR5838560.1 hypothetical protein [Caballeronia sp. LZ034LL]
MSEYRKSTWRYETGALQSMSIGPFSAVRGVVVLSSPDGRKHKYNEVSFGFNVGKRIPVKFQLPDIPLPHAAFKGNGVTGSGSTIDFDGGGVVFMTPTFQGDELSTDDFSGAANSIEGGGGLLVAYGYTFLFTGMPQAVLLAGLSNPAFLGIALRTAKGLIIIRGISEGLIDGLGVTSSFGALSYGGEYVE